MQLRLGKKKLKVKEVSSFWERFKTLKLDLKPLEHAILFPNRKSLSTYFFCQPIDVVMTNEDNIILYMYPKLKTEKRIFYKRKVTNIYILPLGSCKQLNVGMKLTITNKNN